MTLRKQTFVIAVVVVVILGGAGLAGYFGVRTFSHMGEAAIPQMSAEEREWLARLGRIDRRMQADDVYRLLGEPTNDVLLAAKWNGFAGSRLSQLRVYFVEGHPRRLRWMKLGYFVYEKDL